MKIKNTELFISVRQLKAKFRQTLMAVLSVSVGVMILIAALSLTNGFEQDLINKILGTNPHISVEPGFSDRIVDYQVLADKIKKYDSVESVEPVIRGQALINSGLEVKGVLVYGISDKNSNANSEWKKYLIEGSLPQKGSNGIVIGSELAKKTGVGVGEQLQLITGVGVMQPLTITGVFQADFYEVDVRVVIIDLQKAQEVYSLPAAVNFLSIKLSDPFVADDLSKKITKSFFTYSIRSWLKDNKALLAAMQTEKIVIFIVMMFIIIVAMLGIANLLVMIVLEKTKEIGILRAIGASKKSISKIFLYQGLFIGVSGILLGCSGGYLISSLLAIYPLSLPNDIYIIGTLPIKMKWQDFFFVSLSTFFVCLLASIVPAKRAVKLNPVEAIRRIG